MAVLISLQLNSTTIIFSYLFKHWVFLLQHKEFGRFLFHLSLQLDHVNILLNICPVLKNITYKAYYNHTIEQFNISWKQLALGIENKSPGITDGMSVSWYPYN